MTDNLYYSALIACGNRYHDMVLQRIDDDDYWGGATKYTRQELINLYQFIREFLAGCENQIPLLKLNRWLGYIQGSLIAWGITTVTVERDWTRPLFRPLDFPSE